MALTEQNANSSQPGTVSPPDSITPSTKIVLATAHRLGAESTAWCLAGYGSFRDVLSVNTVNGLLRIAQGRRVSEVADELEISSKAVESHKYRIMKTVGATDRVGLCRWAIREGLIDA